MAVYYIEENLTCIIVLLLFRIQQRNGRAASTEQQILKLLIGGTILFCLSDLVAGVTRGGQFPGARVWIEASNMLYFELLALISFLWNMYVHARLAAQNSCTRGTLYLAALPLLAFTLALLTNPFTHLFFRINAQNLYERNVGVYLHWVVVWGYFLLPTLRVLRRWLGEKNRLKKQELTPLLGFAAAPFAASMVQMVFYGVTTTQLGITISLVMICLSQQNRQILTDALTGINNRRGFDYYAADCIQHHPQSAYALVMIDVDRFKHINDQYGHMVGDQVLQGIAMALKRACKLISNRLYLCRFGGDEFLIMGADCDKAEILRLPEIIREEIRAEAARQGLPCRVEVSMGMAFGPCAAEKDLHTLLEGADRGMYAAKAEAKSEKK